MPWIDDLRRGLEDAGGSSGPSSVELVETHISWVLIAEREVFKLKKPVALDFVDFSTLASRRQACEAEVELNRRLAPDVYLGVLPVVATASGEYRLGGIGTIVDYAVHMRRLAFADRLDVRLGEGRLGDRTLQRLAELLAAFHAACPNDEQVTRSGAIEAIRHNVRENFFQSRGLIEEVLPVTSCEEVERWQLDFLEANAELFAERQRNGRIRDGHGDLRLEHIYVEEAATSEGAFGSLATGQIRVIDAVEFSDRFRHADVCADVAFLVMDLSWHGAVLEAERFLASYARAADDFDLYALVDFYQSYRAFVRGKIATFMMVNEQISAPQRERQKAEARRYFLLSLASARKPLAAPRLVCVGGVIASGKSTVAEALGEAWGVPIVDADRARKSVLGVDPEVRLPERPFSGAYSPEVTQRVYTEMFRRARRVLESGRSVILDASFRSRELRGQARALAGQLGVPFRFVECRCPIEVTRERLARRRAGVSDGRPEIFDEFVASWQEVDELPPEEHRVVATTQPVARALEQLAGLAVGRSGVPAAAQGRAATRRTGSR